MDLYYVSVHNRASNELDQFKFSFVVISKLSPSLTIAAIEFISHADVTIPSPGMESNVLGLDVLVK